MIFNNPYFLFLWTRNETDKIIKSQLKDETPLISNKKTMKNLI